MQQLLSFPSVDPFNENWDAALQAAMTSLNGALRSFSMVKTVQGNVGSPSTVRIQLCYANGDPLAEQVYLRVRVANSAGYAPATHATLSCASTQETITANKDLVVQTDTAGKVDISLTDGTAETFTLLIGPPPVGAPFANFNNSISVTHA